MRVPDWLLWGITINMSIALVLVSWTLQQAVLNWHAVKDTDLRSYAGVKLRRVSFLWVVQASLSIAYMVAVFVHAPRGPLWGAVIVISLLIASIGVAVLSWHHYAEMRTFID